MSDNKALDDTINVILDSFEQKLMEKINVDNFDYFEKIPGWKSVIEDCKRFRDGIYSEEDLKASLQITLFQNERDAVSGSLRGMASKFLRKTTQTESREAANAFTEACWMLIEASDSLLKLNDPVTADNAVKKNLKK